jgi:hypothetical protein
MHEYFPQQANYLFCGNYGFRFAYFLVHGGLTMAILADIGAPSARNGGLTPVFGG